MKQKRNRKAYLYDDELDQFTLNLDDHIGKTTVTPRNKKVKDTNDSLWYYVGFAGDFGFTIAVPIAGGAFAGYLLDQRWNSYPRATLSLLFIGIVISIAGLIKTIKELIRKKN